MNNIEYLHSLEASGILKQLISRGLLPLKVSYHMEIYMQVEARMKLNGGKKRRAVKEVCESLDIDMWTVWNALRQMKKNGAVMK